MTMTQDEVIEDPQRMIEELRQQRDAALAREAALAEVLDVINRSPGDPAPVFEAILEKAHKLCGAALGTLFAYDGAYLRGVATYGHPDHYMGLIRQPFRPNAFVHGLFSGERIVHIPDVKASEVIADDEVARTYVESWPARTYLAVPLRKDGTLLGIITANRPEVRSFSEAEIALLESFAAQAVIAMENARLLGEIRQRTSDLQESLEYQTATSEVLKVISRSTFDLDPVFQAVVTTAVRLCRADQATI
jgi:two-component system, NtrC family, sensor kinase